MVLALDNLTAWEVAFDGFNFFPNLIGRDMYGAGFYMSLEQAGEWYRFNPEKAKQLMKEAGYPNGFTTSATWTTATGPQYSIILYAQSQWKKQLGIDMKVTVADTTTYQSQLLESKWQGLLYRYAVDPSFYGAVERSMVCMVKGIFCNFQKLDDPVITDLYSRQHGELDPAKRVALLWQFEQYELSQVYVLRMNIHTYGEAFQAWDLNQSAHGVYSMVTWLAMIDGSRAPKR